MKLQNKFKKFFKKKIFKAYAIYVSIVSLLIFILIYIASSINTNKEIADYSSVNEITININRNGFNPDTVKINPIKEYKFKFSKGIFVTCSELSIEELGLKAELQNQKEIVPIRISKSGTYEILCKEEGIRMKIIVE